MDETPPPLPRRNPLGPLPPVNPPPGSAPPMPAADATASATLPFDVAPEPKLCGVAVWSLVLSLLGWVVPVLPTIGGIICGHIALSEIKYSQGERRGKGWAIGGLVVGYASVLIGLIMIGTLVAFGMGALQQRTASSFEYVNNPPSFAGLMDHATRTTVGDVEVLQVRTHGYGPAQNMQLRIYLPPGAESAAPGSLPCVLTAPAGTDLLSGASLGELDEYAYHDEALPYAQAGMVTVLYSIDGSKDEIDLSGDGLVDVTGLQYDQFREAQAGILNGRYALEFVLAELPMVNSGQIYTAGHSSAGTLSLLLAMYEPRVAGCLAYAPGVDVEAFHAELLETPLVGLIYTNVKSFLRQSSPMRHVDQLQCPTFLFQSREDMVVSIDEFNAFTRKLKARPDAPEFEIMIIREGDHYYPMIEEGIPAGIEWIQEQQEAL